MVLKDVTPIMVLGETRQIAQGKILVQVSVVKGLPLSAVADLALVALGSDRKAIGGGSVVCRTHPVSADRSMRLLVDVIRNDDHESRSPGWYGCVFEVSTFRLSDAVEVVALVGDSLDALSGDMVVTVEDGLSDPHVFPCRLARDDRSAVLATVYRHSSSWKLRAAGLAFKGDRTAIAAELGMREAWPRAEASRMSAGEYLARGGPAPSDEAPPSRPAPVSVSERRQSVPPVPGRPSDAEPAPPPLDLARLSALERDTAAVSALLSDIFTDTGSPPPKIETRSATPSLDNEHTAVLKAVMAVGSMAPADFDRTVRDNGLMASGAVETINDWSFDVVGDLAVIDDGETFSFNEDLRRAVENVI
jgi:hypothetical protein|nr:tellurite resistance TerB C-terminal domain-containing protein [Neorhizobium tomejilense]